MPTPPAPGGSGPLKFPALPLKTAAPGAAIESIAIGYRYPQCIGCLYFDRANAKPFEQSPADAGRLAAPCRRFPPQLATMWGAIPKPGSLRGEMLTDREGVPKFVPQTGPHFPFTASDGYCGEWKAHPAHAQE